KVVIEESDSHSTNATIVKFLGRIQFGMLDITIGAQSDDFANMILNLLKVHNIDQLTLSAKEISTHNSVNFLLELCAVVRSIHIIQNQEYGIALYRNYLLGL
ncbi:hypothetical protein PENTCL1PPCAC_18954, partial [Pristionchus entomophagus]